MYRYNVVKKDKCSANIIKIIIIMDSNEPLFVLEFQFRGLPHAHSNILGYILNYLRRRTAQMNVLKLMMNDVED